MRKEVVYTVPKTDPDNRDAGRRYVIREMGAEPAEKWAWRAFLALAKAGVEIPDNIMNIGMAGLPMLIALIGIRGLAGVDFKDAEPLLDEMFACVAIQPREDAPEITRRPLPEDIEEISTRLILRRQVLELHFDFSKAAAPSNLTTELEPAAQKNGSDTQTSTEVSAP